MKRNGCLLFAEGVRVQFLPFASICTVCLLRAKVQSRLRGTRSPPVTPEDQGKAALPARALSECLVVLREDCDSCVFEPTSLQMSTILKSHAW